VALSPDGLRLVSSDWAKTLKLWDTATGRVIRSFKAPADGVNSLAFSPDGTRFAASSSDKTLKLWTLPRVS
jgi:WD40 repeat protein